MSALPPDVSWYAVDALDDAFDETRGLLVPVSVAVWLRLAVVSLFAGGAFGVRNPSLLANVPPTAGVRAALSDAPRLALLAAVAVAVFLVAELLGSILEFVLVEALRSRTVRLSSSFRRSVGLGVRLFGFRVLLALVVLVPVSLVAALLVTALAGDSVVLAVAGVLLVPLVALLALLVVLVSAGTTSFVVPLMQDRELGVLQGWRAFWPAFRGDLAQFGAYAVVRFALAVLAGVATSVVAGVFAVPVAFATGALALGGQVAVVGLAAAAVLGFLGALCVLVVVRVPTVTYLRYHSLLVLAASDADFSLR